MLDFNSHIVHLPRANLWKCARRDAVKKKNSPVATAQGRGGHGARQHGGAAAASEDRDKN